MRLTFNADYSNAVADLNRAATDLVRWQRAVSSGRRIQVASDDPGAMARVISERAELGSIDQYSPFGRFGQFAPVDRRHRRV